MELKEKKSNIKTVDLNDLDFESLHQCRLERGEVIQDQKLRLKFVLPEVRFRHARAPK